MLQNSVYFAECSAENALKNKAKLPADVRILSYIYAKSVVGKEQGINVSETHFEELKKELGAYGRAGGGNALRVCPRVAANNLPRHVACSS